MSNGSVVVLVLALATSAAADDTTCPAVARTTRLHERHRGGSLEHEGVHVGDVVLKGIVKTAKGYSAMLEDCVDRMNWTVAVGQRFYDGRVTAIDADGITFEVEGPGSSPAPKTTTKRLTIKPAGK